jgi:tripartite-type tricarboxylate transporter receptor subunit TctC
MTLQRSFCDTIWNVRLAATAPPEAVMTIRTLALAFLAALWTLACLPAAVAQDYPNRPIKLIVPYAPGGAADVVARTAALPMGEILGQQFVVENRSGAGGIPGMEALAKSAPDGYTIGIADAGQWAVNPVLYARVPYDPLRDYAPVGIVATLSLFLVVHESVPANTLQELITLVKGKPGFYNYGSSGTGTVHHLTMETFKSALGLDIIHVPYPGTGQSVPALLGGQVAMTISALPSIAAHVKSGKVKVLGANTKNRSPFAPEIPAIAELGLPDFDFPGELALLAPAGTARQNIDKLAAALAQGVRRPEATQRLTTLGMEPVGSGPQQLSERMRADIQRYTRAVKLSGAKAE